MALVGYNVEVAGGDLQGFIGDETKLRQLMSVMLRATVETFYGSIQRALEATTFKNTSGRLNRALRKHVDDTGGDIWMDPTIAPHAPYVERGVHRHQMDYLLKANSAIPIRLPGGKLIFRHATKKWMGRPHPIVVDGKTVMTSGWIHPGYDGKWFFRRGAEDAMRVVYERQKRFVLRLSESGFSSLSESA